MRGGGGWRGGWSDLLNLGQGSRGHPLFSIDEIFL